MRPRIVVYATMGPEPYTGGIENVVMTFLGSRLADEYDFRLFDAYNREDPKRGR